MTDEDFVQYDFENPHWINKLIDRVLMGPIASFRYGPYYKRFDLKGDEHILDFGSGSGLGSREILKRLGPAGLLTCLDISEYWTGKAKKRLKKFKNVGFIIGDIREADLDSGSFDIITMTYVLHDIPPNERPAVIRELSTALKTDGRLHIYEPTRASHGIAVEQVRGLMSHEGLEEAQAKIKRNTYQGVYHFVQ